MRRANIIAGVVVLALGGPLSFAFAQAAFQGEVRRRETPLRLMLGDGFEAASRGDKKSAHYVGNTLLAPDFTLRDQHGRPWRLRDHRGKPIVMNFWTYDCEPCREEMPSLVELDQIARRRGDFEVVTVTIDPSLERSAMLFPRDSELTILLDSENRIVREKFGTRLFPETWIIDGNGVIRMRVDGAREWNSPVAIEVIESFM